MITKEFEGVLALDGDDGYCYGIHLMFEDNSEIDTLHRAALASSGEARARTEVIDFLDDVASANIGKKVKITITVELLKPEGEVKCKH
jgi:hypothetical protein